MDVKYLYDDGWLIIEATKNSGYEMFFSHIEAIDVILVDGNTSLLASLDPHVEILTWRKRIKGGKVKLIARASDGTMTVLSEWSQNVAL